MTAFFVGLGLEVAGRTFLEGEFIDGGIGQHENTWRMAQVRGPEGIAIS